MAASAHSNPEREQRSVSRAKSRRGGVYTENLAGSLMVEALGAFRAICDARLISRAFDPLPQVTTFAILLACSPIFLYAQEASASLTGVLQDPTGTALVGGSVNLEDEGGGSRQETQVDERGVFVFSGLRAGKYTLSMRRLGFYAFGKSTWPISAV